MQQKLASIISYLFHPMLMTTIIVLGLFNFVPEIMVISESSFFPILTTIFILTFIIPAFSIFMLKMTKGISSIKLHNRQERVLPFLFISLYYALTTYFFAKKLGTHDVLIIVLIAITSVIFSVAIISTFYKISAHAAGSWGAVGFFMALHFKYPQGELLWPLVFTLIIAGLVSSSRLVLNTHSFYEVLSGLMLGFCVSFGSILFFT